MKGKVRTTVLYSVDIAGSKITISVNSEGVRFNKKERVKDKEGKIISQSTSQLHRYEDFLVSVENFYRSKGLVVE